MTRHKMPAGAGPATSKSDEALSRDQAAQGFKGQTTESRGIVAQHDAERKAFTTLRATAACCQPTAKRGIHSSRHTRITSVETCYL
jgi:hypothetical protein